MTWSDSPNGRATTHPELSGGQQQRVTIARALVNQPEIVWADEPTGNLDSTNSEEIMDLLSQLNKENLQTFILVTHSDAVAARAHRIINMLDGQIIDDGHVPSSATEGGVAMDELFGAPVSSIAVVLAVVFAIIAAALVFIVYRNPILVRMALRNVGRRPARGVLIVIGLMLATAIISAAFTTGDSVTFSIKRVATDSLRSLDELIRVDEDSDVWEGKAVPDEFPESVFHEIAPLLDSDPDVDGVLPALIESVAVVNFRSQQFEVEALYTGLDPARATDFESLKDIGGNPVDLAALGPNEVYIDREGADEIGAQTGDVLGVALRPGDLEQITVKAIVDGWYAKSTDTKLVLMAPLTRAQGQLEKSGQVTFILISNRGDAFEGVDLTSEILERFGDLPVIKEAGLEVFDLKRDVVKEANEVGSLFVSFFTTFGLFSIGVGLLLIFLIFSMLAAERKGEMGVSRAVGMQRRHLIRMFMAEGAIYSVGSAIVGAIVGIGLGYLLVIATGEGFSDDPTEEFNMIAHVEPRSVWCPSSSGASLLLQP